MKAAEALGYRPNSVAQALAGASASSLGLVLPCAISNPFYSTMAESLFNAASDRGLGLLCSLPADPSPGSYVNAMRHLAEHQLRGLLVISNAETAKEYLKAHLPGAPPVVVVGCLDEPGLPLVTVDEVAGGRDLTMHLLSMGHTHIGFVGCAGGRIRPRGRESGYLAAMAQAGRDPCVIECYPTMEGGRAIAARVATEFRELTALVAHNDDVAVGVLRGLADVGVPVPRRISVAGFDDLPISRHTVPALTTAHVPVDRLSRGAVELVLRLGSEPSPGLGEPLRRVVMAPEVVLRESTAPPDGASAH